MSDEARREVGLAVAGVAYNVGRSGARAELLAMP